MPSQGYTEESAEYADDSESGQQVQCPMCGGTGVFDFMPGDVMAPKTNLYRMWRKWNSYS